MALPTKTDLLTLNTAFLGTPFVQVGSKTAAETLTLGLDMAFIAQPFFVAAGGGGGGPGSTRPQLCTNT